MKREYDEAEYLKNYIFRWHRDLIPEDKAFPDMKYFMQVVPSASSEDIAAILSHDEDAEVSTPAMERSLLAAWDTFNASLCDSLITKHNLEVRRCPQCNKLLESPSAKICLWCDYNEYKADNKASHHNPPPAPSLISPHNYNPQPVSIPRSR